jgi:predicted RND superfamily exporter protein
MPKFIIMFIGFIPLVFTTDWLRATLGDFLSFGVVIIYIVILHLLAEKYGKNLRDSNR